MDGKTYTLASTLSCSLREGLLETWTVEMDVNVALEPGFPANLFPSLFSNYSETQALNVRELEKWGKSWYPIDWIPWSWSYKKL